MTLEGPVKIVSFPEVAPGVILECSYELASDDLSQIPPWMFQNDDFTRVSRFELQLPDGLAYMAFFGGLPGTPQDPDERRINDPESPRRILNRSRWELHNQPALREKPFLASAEDARATLYVQLESYETPAETRPLAHSWNRIADDARRQQSAFLEGDEGVEAWAAAAISGATTPGEKAQALFRLVRDDIAPTADTRIDAMTAEEMLATGRGPAPSKNVLLASLLQKQGIPADVIRIRTRDRGVFYPRYRCLRQLNHAVVRAELDGGSVLLDAAYPFVPFGQLPLMDHVEQGLLVGDGSGTLISISAPSVPSTRGVKTTAKLDGEGTLVAQSKLRLTGYPALDARTSVGLAGERAFVQEMLKGRFPGASLETVEIANLENEEAPLTLEIAYRVKDYARGPKDRMTCLPPFLLAMEENPLPDEERHFPLDFAYRVSSKEEVRMTFEDGMNVARVPKQAASKTGEIAFTTVHVQAGDELRTTRKFKLGQQKMSEREYAALRGFYDDLVAADTAELVVARATKRSMGTR
jgi:hypothetical protein